nr:putative lipase atg15 [Quercus suber]
MRCFGPTPSRQPTPKQRPNMLSYNMILTFALLVASLIVHIDAARPLSERGQYHDPFLGIPPTYEQGTPAKSLGERNFVGLRSPCVTPDAKFKVTTDYGETFDDAPTVLRARALSTNVQRLVKREKADMDKILAYFDVYGAAPELPSSAWTVDEVAGPNITDKETILSFARMAANAYIQEHDNSEWIPVGGGFNYTDDFGWEADGLRGHVYADETNATVVIGLKGTSVWPLDVLSSGELNSGPAGTSPAVFDGVDTTGNDKLNDNLFGSCCCGQGGQLLWKTVCDCMTSAYTCNNTCLVKTLREKSHYYWAVRDLYHNVTERYPQSDVWVAGHSLGGVVSSLLGLTYGLPTITYEAFPDALAASRLRLPTPPGYQIGSHQSRFDIPIHHVGHTADPIFMGSCNGASSFCSIAGYAFQGMCHTGKTCIYDTVGDLGWRIGIGTHKITNVIRDVLQKYDTVPACVEDIDCQDCNNWKFYESNSSKPITSSHSSSSSSTRTRTATCKTPGWWGCLDESSTTTGTVTTSTITSTSSSSTSTCKTPGWFGCKDPVSTTTKTSSSTSSPKSASATTTSSTTTSCLTPGWLGCNDPTPTTAALPSSTVVYTTPTPTNTAPCEPSTKHQCISRHWYGRCQTWEGVGSVPKNDLR